MDYEEPVTPRISVRGLGTVRLFDVGGVITIAGLAAAFVWSAFRTARELYAAEPLARAVALGHRPQAP